MSQKKYRVAIIGTGMIANIAHIPSWKAMASDVEIVAAADVWEERVNKVGEVQNIPNVYSDWQKMLDEIKPDIVSVCTPNVYHKAPTIAALKSGAHVVCEKPITVSTADAEEMYDVAESVGKELFISQTTRFTNEAFAAKSFVEAGKMGNMYYAETAWFRRRGVPTWGVFHMKEHNAGGPIYDLGVHMLDLIIWVMGNPKIVAVSGMATTKLANTDEKLATSLADSGAPEGAPSPTRPYDYREFDVEDFAVGLMRLENGGSVVLRTSWAANVSENVNNTFIMGTQAGLQLRPNFELINNVGSYQANTNFKVPSERNVSFAGHFACIEHVIRVIRGEEEKIVKRTEVLNIMRALEGLYKSSDEGREIKLV